MPPSSMIGCEHTQQNPQDSCPRRWPFGANITISYGIASPNSRGSGSTFSEEARCFLGTYAWNLARRVSHTTLAYQPLSVCGMRLKD